MRCIPVIRVTQWSPKVNECHEVQWKTTETAQTFRTKLKCSRPSMSAMTDDSTWCGLWHTPTQVYLKLVKKEEWGEGSAWDDFEIKKKESEAPNQTRPNETNNDSWHCEQYQRHPPLLSTLLWYCFNFKLNFNWRQLKKNDLWRNIDALVGCRIFEPCSRFILHKSKVETRRAGCKASFHILEGFDSTCAKSCFAFLPASPEHQLCAGCATGVRNY